MIIGYMASYHSSSINTVSTANASTVARAGVDSQLHIVVYQYSAVLFARILRVEYSITPSWHDMTTILN